MAIGAWFTFLSSVKVLHPLLRCRSISRAMSVSCVVTVVESVFRRAHSWSKAMICSSEQCLPNLVEGRYQWLYVCYLLPRGQWEWRPPVLQGAWRWRVPCFQGCLYIIRLDETRAEIHLRSSEICMPLFSSITHILESLILSSFRTRILNPRRRLRGIDDSPCCACRSKAFCLKRAIWLRSSFSVIHLCLWLLWFMLFFRASAFCLWYSTEIEWHLRPKSSLFSLIMAVEVPFMNLNLCLIRLPILLSQSFRRSGSQGVTKNAYAMLGMIAVIIMCIACQGVLSFWQVLTIFQYASTLWCVFTHFFSCL